MFSSTEIESLTYNATNLISLVFHTVITLDFKVEYALKDLRNEEYHTVPLLNLVRL